LDLPDVNIFVHAFRRDSTDHELCRTWLVQRLRGADSLAVSPHALAGFVRVVTHLRVFRHPSRLNEALGFCEQLLGSAACMTVQPGAHHWGIFTSLCRVTNAVGNDIPDTWFAALAIENDCCWITLDRGFARFPDLQLSAPSL
jgi:toxin-antitoxin system PIN domain toxin